MISQWCVDHADDLIASLKAMIAAQKGIDDSPSTWPSHQAQADSKTAHAADDEQKTSKSSQNEEYQQHQQRQQQQAVMSM
jgi:hypothetical protein